jgi:hypothetical protein
VIVIVRLVPLCLLAVACSSAPSGPAQRPGGELADLALVLVPGPARVLEVEGSVGPNPARVLLDLTRPLTLVADGCLAGVEVASTGGKVEVPRISGGKDVYPEVGLRGLRVGPRRLAARPVGVMAGEAVCRVWLGLDALLPYALEIDPVLRRILLVPSRPTEAYALMEAQPGEEVALASVSREPTTDVPLVPVRVALQTLGFAGAFVLSTAEEHSSLFLPPGTLDTSGPQSGTALGEVELVVPEQLELAPGFSLRHIPLRVEEGEASAVVGRLGADVWGRFHTILDVKAGILRLARPRIGSETCSSASCVQTEVLQRAEGSKEATVTLWGVLPEGGVAHLQARNEAGVALCDLALWWTPSSAGESLSFPLTGSEVVGGGCAATAASLVVTGVKSLAKRPCAGVCVSVREPATPAQCVCRAGSELGREAPAPAGVESPAEEELIEPEDPPPGPRRRPKVTP